MNSMKLYNIQEQINTNHAIQWISLQLQKPNKYFKKMKFKEFNSSQNNQTWKTINNNWKQLNKCKL